MALWTAPSNLVVHLNVVEEGETRHACRVPPPRPRPLPLRPVPLPLPASLRPLRGDQPLWQHARGALHSLLQVTSRPEMAPLRRLKRQQRSSRVCLHILRLRPLLQAPRRGKRLTPPP
eukprot:CAMPEP_0172021894 /NCGR_PEP_ID=MMETSP1041-20130122/13962_1 /TAXON_ID=464988 /ORGANISM="Hemiselmis andersenii, Strain CCMP439" /LENGTH=117 /DNA_ID=CAMNT_0012677263 /DNA_START=58 /DNA_END=407 /DNA_ORIENTATION=-